VNDSSENRSENNIIDDNSKINFFRKYLFSKTNFFIHTFFFFIVSRKEEKKEGE